MIPAVLTLLVGFNPLVTGMNRGFYTEVQQIGVLRMMGIYRTSSQEKNRNPGHFTLLLIILDHPRETSPALGILVFISGDLLHRLLFMRFSS